MHEYIYPRVTGTTFKLIYLSLRRLLRRDAIRSSRKNTNLGLVFFLRFNIRKVL